MAIKIILEFSFSSRHVVWCFVGPVLKTLVFFLLLIPPSPRLFIRPEVSNLSTSIKNPIKTPLSLLSVSLSRSRLQSPFIVRREAAVEEGRRCSSKMPLGDRAGDKSESRYCGVETEFDDDMPQLLVTNLSSGGFDYVVAPLVSIFCISLSFRFFFEFYWWKWSSHLLVLLERIIRKWTGWETSSDECHLLLRLWMCRICGQEERSLVRERSAIVRYSSFAVLSSFLLLRWPISQSHTS